MNMVVMQNSGNLFVNGVVAREAWKEYNEQHMSDQSFERIQERGGFAENELMVFLYCRIKRLEGDPTSAWGVFGKQPEAL